MITLPGAAVSIGLDVDKAKGTATFKVDGHPEFTITIGQLNRLLAQTCLYVAGTRYEKPD